VGISSEDSDNVDICIKHLNSHVDASLMNLQISMKALPQKMRSFRLVYRFKSVPRTAVGRDLECLACASDRSSPRN
jgi:hypothetical protein